MEDGDGHDGDSKASDNLTPIPPKTRKRKQQTKPKLTSKEPENPHKKSFRKSWRSSGPVAKLTVIFAGLAAAAGIGYVGVTIWQTLQAKWTVRIEHAPLVINSRNPEMLQPMVCDREAGLHTGNMRTTVKNVGNARAVRVMPFMNLMKIVPEKKTGNAFIDELPRVNCNWNPAIPEAAFNLAPGQETSTGIRQTAGTTPNLPEGTVFQLYFVSCVYYSDDYGANHATCDTYRLEFPSTNPLDVLGGSPSFVCDRTPRTGRFFGAIT
jgi:hypothetical protein